jgi:hypothetical protein
VPPFSWVVAVTAAGGAGVRGGGSIGSGVRGLGETLGRADAGGTTGGAIEVAALG